jgi:hypothetical protein
MTGGALMRIRGLPIVIGLLCIFLLPSLSPVFGAGSVHVRAGASALSEDAEPAEDQTLFGLDFTFGGDDWPVLLAVDISSSSGDGVSTYYYGYGYGNDTVDAELSITELDVGVRKIWGAKSLRPFVGGGLSVVDSEIEGVSALFGPFDVDDTTPGVWVDGGIVWRIGKGFEIGLDARYSLTVVEYDFGDSEEEELELSGFSAGLLVGWGW